MHTQGFGSLYAYLSSLYVALGQCLLPICTILIFVFSGYYVEVIRKSRLNELLNTAVSISFATLGIFFIVLINDVIDDRIANYELVCMLWLSLFMFVYGARVIYTSYTIHLIRKGDLYIKALIIGSSDVAYKLYSRLESMKTKSGYKIIGFVNIPGESRSIHISDIECFAFETIKDICKQYGVEEFIIAPANHDFRNIFNIVNKLFPLSLPIKIIPNVAHILISRVRISDIENEILIDVAGCGLSDCELILKRTFDVCFSLFVLIFLSPLFLSAALAIRLSSNGPIFYKQQRIGYRNIPFNIIKFRTMIVDSEPDGIPQLTKDNDLRITKIGKFLRKYRIDEIPQFWNVIKGEMSIVGPRPEREYFINQILQKAPYYALLHQIRPGITSMGMVKYGYASTIDEMLERLKFDIIYIENMSLVTDMKIIIYTIKTVITGKGL